MFTHLSPTYKGILFALAGYTGFSIADACAKYLTNTYSVFQVVTIDTLMAAAILLALSPWLGGAQDLFAKRNLKIHGARTFLNFFINIMIVFSLMILPIASVYTLIFVKPFFAVLFAALLFHEKIQGNRIFAILIGFAGVLIAFQPWSGNFEWTLIIPLAAAAIIAAMFLLARKLDQPSLFSIGFFPLAGSGLMTAPFLLWDYTPVYLFDWGIFALQSAALATGIIGISMAFRMAEASIVSPFLYTQMIWALIFGFFIFGDVPDLWMLIGGGIIIASGAYLFMSERKAST